MWSILKSSRLVELLPECLAWAPETLPQDKSDPPKAKKGQPDVWYLFRNADHAADKQFQGGFYAVAHYPPAAGGDAFGPLALDQVLSFCRLMGNCLQDHGKVAYATPKGDVHQNTNAAVLIGAYLILYKQWTVAQLEKDLRNEAARPFKMVWKDHRSPHSNPTSTVKVKHCWSGIAAALEAGLLDRAVLLDTESERFCNMWRQTLMQYDACWFADGEVVVGADPMTVICDPNKVTCPALTPPPDLREEHDDDEKKEGDADGKNGDLSNGSTRPSTAADPSLSPVAGLGQAPAGAGNSQTPSAGGLLTPSGLPKDLPANTSPARVGPTLPVVQSRGLEKLTMATGSAQAGGGRMRKTDSDPSMVRQDSAANMSVHSACKQYNSAGSDSVQGEAYPQALDFVSFCNSVGIKQVVRANKENEPGLKEIGGSYAADQIEAFGIKHFNAPFNDTHGAVPTALTVKNVIEATSARDGVIYFHCKGGFGRSVVLACCYLIYAHDVPGSAILGWCRIARPGAITTEAQELFLASMKGRDDLEKYMNGSSSDPLCCALL
mmetsp:Transcript_8703/g.19411  ORF Transcript_8703/g.19411 Transcript_8703/m.19411 type:complete len:550 (-) Transcript_8703:155-1804(-)